MKKDIFQPFKQYASKRLENSSLTLSITCRKPSEIEVTFKYDDDCPVLTLWAHYYKGLARHYFDATNFCNVVEALNKTDLDIISYFFSLTAQDLDLSEVKDDNIADLDTTQDNNEDSN